jgi:hypothetical protein
MMPGVVEARGVAVTRGTAGVGAGDSGGRVAMTATNSNRATAKAASGPRMFFKQSRLVG